MKRLFVSLILLIVAVPAWAEIDIQKVTSEKGITAWLVEEHSIPFTALELRFRGGTSLDEPGKRGATNLMAALLEEGAGDLDALTDAVLAFMDSQDIEAAHLVGHSMGGAVSARLATTRPERARSLTLIASAGLGDDIDQGYIDGFVTAASRRDLKPVLSKLFADQALVGRRLVDDLLKYKRLDGVDAALAKLRDGLFAGGRQKTPLAGAIAAADLPVLVIWGTEDRVIPAAHATAVPGATVEVLPDAGHMVQMEAAARVNELIRRHIGG